MEFKVKAIDGIEQKSIQEVESKLLESHEEKFTDSPIAEKVESIDVINESPELREEDVISFIKNKYNKEITSVDDLFQAREESEPLPEDVSAYLKYKKDTGRGFEDFSKLNRDFESIDPDKLLKDYLTATEKGLDEEDIDALMEDYSFDEDYDDETTVKKVRLQKKKAIAKAKDYFESQKEKYRIPLESSGSSISDDDKKSLEDYRQYVLDATTYEEEQKRKSDWFMKKTDEVFGGEFKGFEFSVDVDKKVIYAPGDSKELLSVQKNPSTFIQKFLDDDGLLKDAVGYHRSLSIAMNPEKFAKFFYEQGKSIATEDVMRKTKNINMTTRSAPEITNNGGIQVKAVNPSSGRGLKIQSRK
jgi:hypothetical protein